jgi:hypothetical protein
MMVHERSLSALQRLLRKNKRKSEACLLTDLTQIVLVFN